MSTTETLERRDPETIPQRGSGPYGAIVIGALLVVVGGLWLLDIAGVIALEAAIVLPAVLAVIGLGLIFGAWNGPHPGLVVAGVFVTIAVLAVAAAPPDAFHGGIGERSIIVTDKAVYSLEVEGAELTDDARDAARRFFDSFAIVAPEPNEAMIREAIEAGDPNQ